MKTITVNGNAPAAAGVSPHPNGIGLVQLYLKVSDPDLYAELHKREEPKRTEYALAAMKVGLIAFRQAQGQIDAAQVRNAGERVIADMNAALEQHRQGIIRQVGECIREYFDPKGGLFTQRVRGLVGQGDEAGELERIIRRQMEGDGSLLAKTLAAHVGDRSPLMRILDPQSSSGLITLLAQATESTLSEQREQILNELSLDNREGALNRLVTELRKHHGDVGRALEERISSVVGEFSLDRDDSALSRLIGRVENTQRQISNQFSLDDNGSALARMRQELLEVIERGHRSNTEFQLEVTKALAAMTAKKEESERGTRHGLVFEDMVFEFANRRRSEGDVVTQTGNTTGLIRNSKKGDAVLQLGAESAAPGARIVIEVKQDQSYTLQKALAEIAEARRNRGAGIGLFVFSQRTAPGDLLEPLARYGDDVVVVWDAEDPSTDAYLTAALSVARALSVKGSDSDAGAGPDTEALERVIREVERQAGGLDEITKSAQAIDSHVNKILDRARIVRNGLERQVGVLDEQVGRLLVAR